MKKKVIKLNENDIERLVNKIIREERLSELDKETYRSAAEKAGERGMSKLADKFRQHGTKHGTSVIDNLTLDMDYTNDVVTRTFGNIEFIPGYNPIITGTDEKGAKATFEVSVVHEDSQDKSSPLKNIRLYYSDITSLPATVGEAKKLLQLLSSVFDVSKIRPKQITSGYTDFMSEQRKKRLKR